MKKLYSVLYVCAWFAIWLTIGASMRCDAMIEGADKSHRVELTCGVRLLSATWHRGSAWYLVRQLEAGEKPRQYVFAESFSANTPKRIEIIECAD